MGGVGRRGKANALFSPSALLSDQGATGCEGQYLHVTEGLKDPAINLRNGGNFLKPASEPVVSKFADFFFTAPQGTELSAAATPARPH